VLNKTAASCGPALVIAHVIVHNVETASRYICRLDAAPYLDVLSVLTRLSLSTLQVSKLANQQFLFCFDPVNPL
jgi:hypothetical protein